MASPSPKNEHIEELIDGATGKTYYANHLTKSTSWDDPRVAPPSALDLPVPWKAAFLEDGRMFFTDHTNRSTEWRHPERLSELRSAGLVPEGEFDRSQHPDLEFQHSGFWAAQSLEKGEKKGEESWRQFVLPVVADRGEKKGQQYWVDYKLNTASWDSPQDVYDRMMRCEASNLAKASLLEGHSEL